MLENIFSPYNDLGLFILRLAAGIIFLVHGWPKLNPNSPGILLDQNQPTVDIQLGVEATPVSDGIIEVAVTANVHTRIDDRTVFLVEAKQAGIFEIRNLPEDQMGPVLGIACPQIGMTQ